MIHLSRLFNMDAISKSSVSFVIIVLMAIVQSNAACPPGFLNLSSQTAIDNFSTTYVGCRDLPHNILISGPDIENLDGLSELNSVGGFFNITNNPTLTNVDGLSGLTSVGDLFQITSNPLLTNIVGLSSLTSVGTTFNVAQNTSLAMCCGVLPFLTSGTFGSLLIIGPNSAGCNSDTEIIAGCDIIDPIPSMSQWALFILGLCLTSMAVVTIRKRMLATA